MYCNEEDQAPAYVALVWNDLADTAAVLGEVDYGTNTIEKLMTIVKRIFMEKELREREDLKENSRSVKWPEEIIKVAGDYDHGERRFRVMTVTISTLR